MISRIQRCQQNDSKIENQQLNLITNRTKGKMQNQSSLMLTPEQLLKSSKMSRSINQTWVEDLDPLLQGNMKVIYNKMVPVQIRQVDEEGRQIGSKVVLNFRFFIRETGDSQYGQLHMQINSESDLFFVYLCKIDQKRFQKIKKQQGINFPFTHLLSMLVKQLQLCDKQLNQYSAIFYLNPNSNPRLDFIQNIEYKRIQLISFEFQELPQELLKDYTTYRFTKLKKTNQLFVTKIKTIINQVKVKNPKLLKSILQKKQTKSF